jgi:hypothetical protein
MNLEEILTDPRMLSLYILVFCFLAPFAGEVMMPMPVNRWNQDTYDLVTSLGPDDIVWWSYGTVAKPDVWELDQILLKMVWRTGAKIVWTDATERTLILGEELRELVLGPDWKNNVDYGTRFVYLGVIPQANPSFALGPEGVGFYLNPLLIKATDFYGTPAANLPLYQEFSQGDIVGDNIALFMWYGESVHHNMELTNTVKSYGIPIVNWSTTPILTSGCMNQWTVGTLDGMSGGNIGAAELGSLAGIGSEASLYIFFQSIGAVFLVIGPIYANIRWLMRRKKEG